MYLCTWLFFSTAHLGNHRHKVEPIHMRSAIIHPFLPSVGHLMAAQKCKRDKAEEGSRR